ncbi:hypothetical protein BDQ17DRAFT_1429044 [Cyathus striatus]|nr:hypothetical protein BDQ17DRAFT_1429044 [Cyathus striatus]
MPSLKKILKAKAHFTKNCIFTSANKVLDIVNVPGYKPPQPISVYFHMLSDNTTMMGYVKLWNSSKFMNQDYSTTGVAFKLVNVMRMVNEIWFDRAGSGAMKSIQTVMKAKLHISGVKDLNIYTIRFNGVDMQGLLGYLTFPIDYEGNPIDDGIIISYTSLPSGSVMYRFSSCLKTDAKMPGGHGNAITETRSKYRYGNGSGSAEVNRGFSVCAALPGYPQGMVCISQQMILTQGSVPEYGEASPLH